MRKRILVTVSVTFIFLTLLFAAHTVDLMGVMRRMHGG